MVRFQREDVNINVPIPLVLTSVHVMRDIIWLMMKKLAKVGKKKESLTIEIFIYLFQVARKKLIKIMFFNDS